MFLTDQGRGSACLRNHKKGYHMGEGEGKGSEDIGTAILRTLDSIQDRLDAMEEVLGSIRSSMPTGPDKATKMPDGKYRWDIAGKEAKHCSRCGQVVFWCKSQKGRNFPVGEDGFFHNETCPASTYAGNKRPSNSGGRKPKEGQDVPY